MNLQLRDERKDQLPANVLFKEEYIIHSFNKHGALPSARQALY